MSRIEIRELELDELVERILNNFECLSLRHVISNLISNRERIMALSAVVAGTAILLSVSAPSAAMAIICCTRSDCPCDQNPSTGNPHPLQNPSTGTGDIGNPHGQGELGNPHGQGELGNPHGQGEVEVGNPHISTTGSCSGNPHGQSGPGPCPGSR